MFKTVISQVLCNIFHYYSKNSYHLIYSKSGKPLYPFHIRLNFGILYKLFEIWLKNLSSMFLDINKTHSCNNL